MSNIVSGSKTGQQNTNLPNVHNIYDLERGTRIKGLFRPPLEPKTESCFSPISSHWLVRRIAQV